MSAEAPDPLWQVRPPWPDEMDRLPAALREPLGRRGPRRHWLWVLVGGELERVVGGAILAEHDPAPGSNRPTGRIELNTLPVWAAVSAPVEALLDAALAQATTLGLTRIECQADLDTPAATAILARGFSERRRQEVWRVPLEANFARRHAAIERSLARRPCEVRTLDEGALPAVRALCAARGLLPANRVVLARPGEPGLDPRLSLVAGPADAPRAVLLARADAGSPYLEVLALAPETAPGGPEVGALLHAFFRAAMALGASDTICTLSSGHAPGTERLLARAEARLENRFALFMREPTCSDISR